MKKDNKDYDSLNLFRKDVSDLIRKNYPTVEKFCYEEGFEKSLLSRLLSGKRSEFKIKTLKRIAKVLGKKVVIKLE